MIKILKMINFWTFIKQPDKLNVSITKKIIWVQVIKKHVIFFDMYLLAILMIKLNIILIYPQFQIYQLLDLSPKKIGFLAIFLGTLIVFYLKIATIS